MVKAWFLPLADRFVGCRKQYYYFAVNAIIDDQIAEMLSLNLTAMVLSSDALFPSVRHKEETELQENRFQTLITFFVYSCFAIFRITIECSLLPPAFHGSRFSELHDDELSPRFSLTGQCLHLKKHLLQCVGISREIIFRFKGKTQ